MSRDIDHFVLIFYRPLFCLREFNSKFVIKLCKVIAPLFSLQFSYILKCILLSQNFGIISNIMIIRKYLKRIKLSDSQENN